MEDPAASIPLLFFCKYAAANSSTRALYCKGTHAVQSAVHGSLHLPAKTNRGSSFRSYAKQVLYRNPTYVHAVATCLHRKHNTTATPTVASMCSSIGEHPGHTQHSQHDAAALPVMHTCSTQNNHLAWSCSAHDSGNALSCITVKQSRVHKRGFEVMCIGGCE